MPAPGSAGALSQEDVPLPHADLAGPAPAAAPAGSPAGASSPDLLGTVLASLEDDKAEDVVTIDLRGRSSMADAMVICSGRSTRQVSAIAQKLLDRLKERLGLGARTEGMETGDWVLIDAGDVVVHVFRPEVRDFYQLEKMWQPAAAPVPPAGGGGGVRLAICAVGRLRAGPEADLVADYLRRIGRTGGPVGLGPAAVVEVEAKGGGGPAAEALLLERAVPRGAAVCVLDERGRALDSVQFAGLVAGWRDAGRPAAAFLIGGADGLEAGLRARADAAVSFGPMVWPHMLVRAMLAEQLYRAVSILAGTPYHRA